jgi:hypothetical protein
MAKTYDLQKSLQKLPVPKLNDTLDVYLKTLLPLLSEEEYKRVTEIAKDFQSTVGPTLHNRLLER